MKDFVIMTDSCSDLERKYADQNKIPFAMFKCYLGNEHYPDDFGMSLPSEKFYNIIKKGVMPKVVRPSIDDFYELFKKYAKGGKDILYICASSGLSGAAASAHIAENMVQHEFEGVEIYVFDTLSFSIGQGIMVMKALELKERGADMMEIVDYLETNVQKLNAFITLDDISHIKNENIVYSIAALLGTTLKINPVLTVSHEGKILPVAGMKSRNEALAGLADLTAKRIEKPEDQILYICHGNCYEDALKLKNLISEKINVKDISIRIIGPAMGTYTGPGALAVFFFGRERRRRILE